MTPAAVSRPEHAALAARVIRNEAALFGFNGQLAGQAASLASIDKRLGELITAQDEHAAEVRAALTGHHDQHDDDRAAAERRRVTARRWLAGAVIAAASPAATVLIFLLSGHP
jgi:hypothetical protein